MLSSPPLPSFGVPGTELLVRGFAFLDWLPRLLNRPVGRHSVSPAVIVDGALAHSPNCQDPQYEGSPWTRGK